MNDLINLTQQNGQAVVSSREIAEHFEKEHRHVLDSIAQIIENLGSAENSAHPLFFKTTYTHPQNNQQYPMYLMTRDGFSLLAMGFTGKAALEWKLKYIDAFNQMEAKLKPACIEDVLIQSLQEMKAQRAAIAAVDARVTETNQRVDSIREVVALNPNSWREDARRLISKIAQTLGGVGYIRDVTAEIYQAVDARAGCSLKTRLTNKRQRMADEGVCKSKRDKLTKVDIIADDKKLIEIYLAVVKDMAVKNGVALETPAA